MSDMNISSATASDLTTAFANQATATVTATYQVPAVQLDSPADQEETLWTNSKWSTWLGYYKQVPELNSAIDAIAVWATGKGYIADDATTLLLDTFDGWGKDTFNSILAGMVRVCLIGGDAYAEIIRDSDKNLINLKPLSPDSMQHVVNRQGRIIRYQQLNKTNVKANPLIFQPNEIFHLSRNRLADEIHGEGIIRAVEPIILMRNEAMVDWKRVLHRNIDPQRVHTLDTDDTVKINAYKAKQDDARAKGEDIYLPSGTNKVEIIQANIQSSLAWIEHLSRYFYEASGGTDIVIGSTAALTESNAKIKYLAFEQNVEVLQLFIEEQTLKQLNLVIELQFPAKLQSEALSGVSVEEMKNAVEPNDVTAELQGRK